MRNADTSSPTHGASPTPRRPRDEIARLGKEIYRRDIQQQVEANHVGEIVAIDVDSGDYALGANAISASESLRDHRPDAQVWLMRIGHRTLYHFGGGSLRSSG